MPEVLADPEAVLIELPEEARTGGPGGGGPRPLDPLGGGGGDDDDHEAKPIGMISVPGSGLLAMKFALVSIGALFLAISIAYFVRSRSRIHWDPVALPSFLWLSTALMLGSSWTLENARRAFRQLRVDAYARWLVATFFLGMLFLISQLLALRQLLGQGVYLRRNPHSSLFYVVTGAHGAHLLGGLAMLFYLIVRASLRMLDVRVELGRQQTTLSMCALFWHFLDGIWIVMFVLLMLWS